MALLVGAKSDQLVAERLPVVDEHAKVRVQRAYYKNLTGAAGDDGSAVDLFKLPPGIVRILPNLSRVRSSAFGAARVLKIGHREYNNRAQPFPTPTAEDDDAIAVGLDISAAATLVMGAPIKFDIHSVEETLWFGTVTGGTFPTNAELEILLAYVYE